MEYRGKQFTVVQGIKPDSWKWTVQFEAGIIKMGEAKTRPKAMAEAVMAIDRALKVKKRELTPSDRTER